MPNIMKVSILGDNPGGEVWSINPCYHSVTADPVPTFSQMNTVATAINAIVLSAGVTSYFATSTRVTGVRIEHRNLDGSLNILFEQPRAVPVPGTGNTPHPMQTSAVVSLRTALPGATHRGRLYFPATAAPLVAGTMRFTAAGRDSFLLGTKTYLAAIKTALNATLTGYELVVWSRKNDSEALVNKLMVGDVPDVQRRRRDTQVEVYGEQSYP
jgi:hypothetical protein